LHPLFLVLLAKFVIFYQKKVKYIG